MKVAAICLILVLLFACSKNSLIDGHTLVISSEECFFEYKIYTALDSNQIVADVFDCKYIKESHHKIKPGTYFIKADNGYNLYQKTFTIRADVSSPNLHIPPF
jgi:hypothetical protein